MITFNHEAYIREAIESVLMQKGHFQIKLIIGEDCSTDKTRQICQEYASKHSEINLLPSETNLGMMPNFIRTLQACTGYYTALCEGDDYWTDPLKLQKQIDFLDANPDYSACFTNAEQVDGKKNIERLFVVGLEEGYVPEKTVIIKGGGLYPTASLVFRRNLFNMEIYQNITELAGDELLIMALATQGKIYFFNKITCIYRNWNGGVFSSIKDNIPKICELKKNCINGYKKFDLITKGKFHRLILRKISLVSLYILLNSEGLGKYRYIIHLYPEEIKRLFTKKIKKMLT
jgi:glycosyltransferase involved in cell wall biosynthesis